MGAFMKRKSSVLLSSGIFTICKTSGKKRIRCFTGQHTIPNPSCCTALIQTKKNALSSVSLYMIHGHFSNHEDWKDRQVGFLSPNFHLGNVKVCEWLGLSPNSKRNESWPSLWSFPTGTYHRRGKIRWAKYVSIYFSDQLVLPTHMSNN